jgi:hypothetical protein
MAGIVESVEERAVLCRDKCPERRARREAVGL